MYCPNCATPIDGVKFCRSCGANVSLVPQALTGRLTAEQDEGPLGRHGRYRRTRQSTIEGAATTFFTGIGFLIASCAVLFWFPGGFTWGWAFLIPAFACIGGGIGQYMHLREQQRKQQIPASYSIPPAVRPDARVPEISAPITTELTSPSSVTEHTTKHLE
ncbi:MAG: zinc ribbon domain-containing protein [Acidobacteria bacterium]|nr:zinc ribbon domain-containing protein [Acidobacteriota bacterium]